MQGILAVFLLLYLALPVAAAEVVIRSGEHQSFTRLVMRIPSQTKWTLENSTGSARLQIDLPDLKLDYGEVFDRVPRKRLSELHQEKAGDPLELQFACDCEARAFVQGGTLLVVDIRHKPASDPPRVLPLVAEAEFASREEDGAHNPIEDREEDTGAAVNSQSQPSETVRQHAILDFSAPMAGERTVETRLYSRIMRGVDQEVLALSPREAADTDDQIAAAQAALSETLAAGLGLPNLRVTTVVDRDLRMAREGTVSPTIARQCVEDQRLAVPDWADDRSFSIQYAILRDGLYGEFDRINAQAALALVRFYIHFGFGDEAKVNLDLLQPASPDRHLLAALAAAVEGRPAPAVNPLAGLQGCDNDAAMWSVLSERYAPQTTNTNAVLRSYGRLPVHLRAYLGPVLGGYLTDAGFVDAAQQLVRAVERSDEGDTASVAVVEAKLAGLKNEPAVQEKKLTEVIEDASASTHAPLALIDLIEKRWAEGGDVTEQELLLAASFVHEYRRSEIGPQIQTAYVVAQTLSAQFDEAMTTLLEPAQDRESGVWRETVDRVVKRITSHGDDITFLRHVAMLESDLFLSVNTDTATQVAQRLNDLGFFEDALRFADRPQDRRSRSARIEIIARATLGTGRPHRALLELETAIGAEVDRLRAQAMHEAGALEQAAEALVRAGDLETASRYVWLAGADTPVSGGEDTRFGEIHLMGRALLEDNGPVADTPLAAARELVEESTRVRDQIGDLLNRLQ